MKEKNKKIKISIISIIIVTIVSILGIIYQKYNNGVVLTQMHDNSPRQMMGYVIQTKNKTIVIDGGLKEDSENLQNKIKECGNKVDVWFLTHPHMDHVQAFLDIAENTDIQIDKIYATYNDLDWYKQNETSRIEEIENFFKVIESEKIKNKVEQVQLNEKINIENIKCEILGIKNPEITNNPINNSSMVIKMKINDKSLLFLGDTGKESGEKLLKNQGDKLKSDIVQMAHHGQSGVDEDVYQKIDPQICLWPTPKWLWDNDPGTGYNTGKWTTIETRSWMEKLGVKTNYIEKDGDISFRIW